MGIELPVMDPCLFCERAAGRRGDWVVIEEDADTITFLNPVQYEAGQTCVIPRRHAPTLIDLTDEEARDLVLAAKRVARAMVQALDPDGLLLYQNNGLASGQAVPHVHFHVVPRRAGSDWGLGPPHLARAQQTERADRLATPSSVPPSHVEIAARIRACLPHAGTRTLP